MQKKTALFLGRFQPPHRGHEQALGWLLGRHENALVAIGSSNRKREMDNPFSAAERKYMLEKIIASHIGWAGRVKIAFLPDMDDHHEWTKKMLARFAPEKYLFYSNNRKLVREHLLNAGVECRSLPFLKKNEFMGKEIRRKVREGKKVTASIPGPIREFIDGKGKKIICSSK